MCIYFITLIYNSNDINLTIPNSLIFYSSQQPNSYPPHSPQYELLTDNEFISLTFQDRQKITTPGSRYLFTGFAALYMLLDNAWMFAVWSAASVGKLSIISPSLYRLGAQC